MANPSIKYTISPYQLIFNNNVINFLYLPLYHTRYLQFEGKNRETNQLKKYQAAKIFSKIHVCNTTKIKISKLTTSSLIQSVICRRKLIFVCFLSKIAFCATCKSSCKTNNLLYERCFDAFLRFCQ